MQGARRVSSGRRTGARPSHAARRGASRQRYAKHDQAGSLSRACRGGRRALTQQFASTGCRCSAHQCKHERRLRRVSLNQTATRADACSMRRAAPACRVIAACGRACISISSARARAPRPPLSAAARGSTQHSRIPAPATPKTARQRQLQSVSREVVVTSGVACCPTRTRGHVHTALTPMQAAAVAALAVHVPARAMRRLARANKCTACERSLLWVYKGRPRATQLQGPRSRVLQRQVPSAGQRARNAKRVSRTWITAQPLCACIGLRHSLRLHTLELRASRPVRRLDRRRPQAVAPWRRADRAK